MQIRLLNLQRAQPIPQRRVQALAARLLKRFRVHGKDVSIVFVGDQRMRTLNRRFHRRDRVTDVLAFDLRGPAERRRAWMLGDVIVAPAVARRQARDYGHTYAEELLTYVAHGLLHLLGFRDGSPRQRARMHQWQHVFIKGA